jgi:hypothetical protein
MKRKADIADNGTVCLYKHTHNKLRLYLYGKTQMDKQHREESETSDNEHDIRSHHVPLASLNCSLKGHQCYVEYSNSQEEGKGYSKLLYLKLAKWCRSHNIKSITGHIQNDKAIPFYVRKHIPSTHTRIWIDPYWYEATQDRPEMKDVEFKESACDADRFTNKYEVMNPSSLTKDQLIYLVPFWVSTELL